MSLSPPRIAIVTGAGSGLGRAFCRRLAQEPPVHIVAIDRDETSARETLAHATGEALALDVTDREAWRRLADRLAGDLSAGRLGRVDVLINNAGVCAAAETLGSDGDQWRRVMEVNFFGVLNGCQAIGPLMTSGARIINVASILGLLGGPAMGAYSASKAAVVALSEAMYAEMRPAGVGVTVAAPGFFRTGLLEAGAFGTPRHRSEAERLSQRSTISADDVARIALAASERRQLYAVMGGRARWVWRLKRLAPRMVQRIVARRYYQTFGVEK
jgi:NAD(P)-dependent dehydrogenase (short-subunit alcohol dehydrogenase family)